MCFTVIFFFVGENSNTKIKGLTISPRDSNCFATDLILSSWDSSINESLKKKVQDIMVHENLLKGRLCLFVQ